MHSPPLSKLQPRFKPLSTQLKSAVLLALLLSFTLIIFRAFEVENHERKSLYGDGYSDQNTYSAVVFFKDFGFTKSYLLPIHNYWPKETPAVNSSSVDENLISSKKNSVEKVHAYTHYPALPDVMSGIFAAAMNTVDVRFIRLGPTFLSLIQCLIMWLVLRSVLYDPAARVLSFTGIILSNYFISYADNLHKHIYEEFFKWLTFFLLLVYYRGVDSFRAYKFQSQLLPNSSASQGVSRMFTFSLYGILGLTVFLAANASFEPITFIAILVVGMSIVFEKKIFTPLNFWLGAMTAAGFFAHFYQNILWFGGYDKAYADLFGAFSHRTGTQAESGFSLLEYLRGFLDPVMRFERMFFIPGAALVLLWPGFFKSFRKTHPLTSSLAVVLLIAAYGWTAFMPQHAEVHPFTVKAFGPFYGVICGPLVLYLAKRIRQVFAKSEDRNSGTSGLKWYWAVMIIYIAGFALTQQIFPVFIRYGFFHEFF